MKQDLYAKSAEIIPFRRIPIPAQKTPLKTMIANEIIIENGNYVCQNQFYTKMIFLLYISETSL